MTSRNKNAVSRRRVLQGSAGLALGGLGAGAAEQKATAVYASLGVKRVINATGTVTILGGSLMPPEVAAAWVQASRHFVNLLELHDKVGVRIAQLAGVEAALVTTGAAGALFLGTAAAVTRGDANLISRLPDTTGMRHEVLIQKTHHSCYDNQLTGVGAKLLDVETAADVERLLSDRTALMFFMNYAEAAGKISRKEWLALARKHKVPTLLDAAADVLPAERLSAYTKMGFDMVAFSGGKALRGPNDTGLLLGRKRFIEAAKKNANPHCGTIGRMMKVGKEDMVALLAAVERFVRLDHKAEWREWERRIGVIEAAVKGVPTVECERVVPPIANEMPHLRVTWDERRVGLTRERLTKELAAGDPPILIGRVRGTGEMGVVFSVLTLEPGEDAIVANRMRGLFKKSPG